MTETGGFCRKASGGEDLNISISVIVSYFDIRISYLGQHCPSLLDEPADLVEIWVIF